MIPKGDGDEKPSAQMRETFEEEGWNFAATLQDTFYVFYNDAEYPKPVPFSKEEERDIYEKLFKKKRNSIIFSAVSAIILLGMQLWLLYLKFNDYILGKDHYTGYAYILALMINMIGANREYRSYSLLKRKLEGIDAEEEVDSPYIPTTKWIRVETLINVFIGILMIFPLISMMTEGNVAAVISEDEIPFSYVSLEEIEMPETDRDYYNDLTHMESSSSFLAPVQYKIEQDGKTIDHSNGRQETDDDHLSLSYYELRFKALGNQTLQGMMEYSDTTEVAQEGTDQAWIAEDIGETEIFLLKENKILAITYYGEANLLPYLDEYAEILQPQDAVKSQNPTWVSITEK
ncbi:MAG: hypothetical protein EOM28_02300 [Clostridia bacterium]|nr:hypothetical protein [Clostridia bacterium]